MAKKIKWGRLAWQLPVALLGWPLVAVGFTAGFVWQNLATGWECAEIAMDAFCRSSTEEITLK